MMIFFMVAMKDIRKNNHLVLQEQKNVTDVKYRDKLHGHCQILLVCDFICNITFK